MVLKLRVTLAIALTLAFATPYFQTALNGQQGTSSMSVGATRAGVANVGPGGRFRMPSPDMIRIEEYVNFHRHDIPLPDDGERVHLDTRHLNLESGKTVVQFGLTTPRNLAPESIPPLNLVLVIDESGSMSGDRIENVKTALLSFVERLRRQDRITIVGFSHDARVHLSATDKTRTQKISNAISQLRADGSTNLHAGLMLGYQKAKENFDEERTNRVILLSDGVANQGTVDSEEITRQSKAFNKQGIDLSTIGLGQDFNHELLRELADAGRGLIHFVGDSKDIEKTFICEIESLLAPAARKVRLSIDFGQQADSIKVYGYQPKKKDNRLIFRLDDLNHGVTQVVLARLPEDRGSVTASLSYVDAITGEAIHTEQTINLKKESSESVRKNYSIALVAESLKKAAVTSNEGDCEKAERQLSKGIKAAKNVCVESGDPDLGRVVKIAKDYRTKIRECIANFND